MKLLAVITFLVFSLTGAAMGGEPILSDIAVDLSAGTRVVIMETEKGTMEIQLFDVDTPITADNFAQLVQDGFYNGMPFHRVEPGFVIQAGDPEMAGLDPLDITLIEEPDKHKCERGRISMARGFDNNEYAETSPTQFFITISTTSHLDPDFCFFGEVVTGIATVDALKQDDKITKATLVTVE